jgi:uncharacterized protein YjaZ
MYYLRMALIAVRVWMAGLSDWMVAYATSLAQLGVWVTRVSVRPLRSRWTQSKNPNISAQMISHVNSFLS